MKTYQVLSRARAQIRGGGDAQLVHKDPCCEFLKSYLQLMFILK